MNLNKDVLNLICDNLEINDIKNLRAACSFFKKCLPFKKITLYFCMIDSYNVPLDSDINLLCFKTAYDREVSILKIHAYNYNDIMLSLFASTAYEQMIRTEDYEPLPLGTTFKPTSRIISEKISFTEEELTKKYFLKLHKDMDLILRYIFKEIRKIQNDNFSFQGLTKLETKIEKDRYILILYCLGGEIFNRTDDILVNLLKIFNIYGEE